MKLIILGAAESGIGAAILAQKEGFDVFVSDSGTIKPDYKTTLIEHNIEFEERGHEKAVSLIERVAATSPPKTFSPCSFPFGESAEGDRGRGLREAEIIKSPGIPENAPIVQKIRAAHIPIISEIEFAKRYTDAKMICITGSNGKTTTTSLIYYTLKNAGLNVGLAGNIGKSLAWQVAECSYDCYVVELSSFQLDDMYDFKADIAILLNITPDHLDRYDHVFQNYVNAKFRIIQNQTAGDVFIYWNDDPVITAELSKREITATRLPFALTKKSDEAAYIENNELIINTLNNKFTMPQEEIALQGLHNLYNTMAAGLAAEAMNVKKEAVRESFRGFQGVEHRLEYVATVRGVRYINDSKATNVNSCWYALQSMKTPVVLILGGTDKGNDYTEIEPLVSEKVHTLIFMGVDNHKLHQFFDTMGKTIVDTHSLDDAVNAAYAHARKGDTVLLSPCCASFDLFENYEDRGRQFKEKVKRL